MLFYIIAFIVVIIDQMTKILVRIHVEMNERFTWWGIEFKYIENSGMAGGLFPGYARIFGVVAILFVLGVLYLRRTEGWSGSLIDSSLGFLVGGAIGNGIDRLLRGEVTDFIIRSGGILNVADHALEIGLILLVISAFLHWLKSKKSKKENVAIPKE